MGLLGFMGEVKLFAGNYAPKGWMFCWGQLLAINDYQALFAILSTTYGGDGRTTFGLPDLRGRVAVGAGHGPGRSTRILGQWGGVEQNTLQEANIPPHQHSIGASTTIADQVAPAPNMVSAAHNRDKDSLYTATTPNTTLQPTGSCGDGHAIDNMPPWLALEYIICIEGDWPSRP